MKKINFLLFCHFIFISAFAQLKASPELLQRLNGKTKFYDIKNTVENYYKDKLALLPVTDSMGKKQINRQRKFWNRYFFEAESHLDNEGKVVNAIQRNLEYLSNNENNSLISYGNWTSVGPSDVTEGIGRINRVAFDPMNPAIIYAGSAGGGLFKSTTTGTSWSNISSFLPSLGISGIVVSHDNSNTIYILTGDGDAESSGGFTYQSGYIRYSAGIFKSTDGGNSWYPTGTLPGIGNKLYNGLRLVQDPNNADILLAATTRGLFRTTNGGNSWAMCNLGNATVADDSVFVYDVKFAPGNSNLLYCAIRNNNNSSEGTFLRSTDGGNSFPFSNTVTFTPNSFTGVQRIGIAVTPADPMRVYLLAGPGNAATGSFKGVWLSFDNGAAFTRLAISPDVLGRLEDNEYDDQNLYDLAIAVSPTNVNTVIAAGLVIFKSTTGGITFSQQTPYHGSASIHPDVHDLAFNPLNGYLYAATDGGIAVSSDNGSNWAKLFSGLSCTQFYHFGIADDGGNTWGGTQDNGILIKNGSASSFSRYAGGDGFDVLADHAPAGNNDDKYYSVNEKVYADAIVDEEITPPGSNNFFANLAMSPTNEDIIYAGYKKLFVSYNRGSDWSDFVIENTTSFVPGNWSINTCPTNRKRIFSAGINDDIVGLFRIDNLDDVLPDVVSDLTGSLEGSGYPSSHPKITDIEVSANGSNILWVTVGGYHSGQKVYYSTSAGNSWTNISDNLPNLPVNAIVADGNDNIYVGTDIGVYYRAANDNNWNPFYNGLPRVAVSELEIGFDANTMEYKLYASTYGRGIWVSDVAGNCPGTLNITATQQGQKFYQASNTINSTSIVNGIAGTNVAFRSAGEINLTPGFNAIPGVEFKAYIGNCYSGLPSFRNSMNETGEMTTYKTDFASFKKTGFIEDAKLLNNELAIDLILKDTGSFSVRIFDNDSKKYISSISYNVSGVGQKNIILPLSNKDHAYLRVDLFKDDVLIFMQDAKND